MPDEHEKGRRLIEYMLSGKAKRNVASDMTSDLVAALHRGLPPKYLLPLFKSEDPEVVSSAALAVAESVECACPIFPDLVAHFTPLGRAGIWEKSAMLDLALFC